MIRLRTSSYERQQEAWREGVVQATFDPSGPGVARLHLIPPAPDSAHTDAPSVLFINGWHMIPVGPAWAALLRSFMLVLNERAVPGVEIDEYGKKAILDEVVGRMRRLYPLVSAGKFKTDLDELVAIIVAVAENRYVPEIETNLSLRDYAKFMRAPHRMDLIVKAMVVGGEWSCPLHCKGCYAAGKTQVGMIVDSELTTEEWMQVIDVCRKAGIPQLTFTGGEATERPDLVELVAHARWHMVRLNTSGVNMTPELARGLKEAELDGAQITLYSHEPQRHDFMVGRRGAYDLTVAGIRNALEAGLSVSTNTPIGGENADFAETIRFVHGLGIRYVSCSGWIPTGLAPAMIRRGGALTSEDLYISMRDATQIARDLGVEVQFTSPGWLKVEQLVELGLPNPICGACLSNMAIMPNGAATSCQSWLHTTEGFGNVLTTPWDEIWNHPLCLEMRDVEPEGCPLKEVFGDASLY